jgi:hypothetical protein
VTGLEVVGNDKNRGTNGWLAQARWRWLVGVAGRPAVAGWLASAGWLTLKLAGWLADSNLRQVITRGDNPIHSDEKWARPDLNLNSNERRSEKSNF